MERDAMAGDHLVDHEYLWVYKSLAQKLLWFVSRVLVYVFMYIASLGIWRLFPFSFAFSQ